MKFLSEEKLSAVILEDVNTGAKTKLILDGVFIYIGRNPETALLDGATAAYFAEKYIENIKRTV